MKCLNCGLNVEVVTSKGYRLSRDSKQFCDDACRYQYHNQKRRAVTLASTACNSVNSLIDLIADYPEFSEEAKAHLADLYKTLGDIL